MNTEGGSIMKRSRTYIASPPGATISEQLQDSGMSQKEFAARIGMPEKQISQLLSGDVPLTPDMASKLEKTLGVPAVFWNRLESIYRTKLAMVERENAMEAAKQFAKKIPL